MLELVAARQTTMADKARVVESVRASPPNVGSAATRGPEALHGRTAVRETERREELVHARPQRGSPPKRAGQPRARPPMAKPKPGGLVSQDFEPEALPRARSTLYQGAAELVGEVELPPRRPIAGQRDGARAESQPAESSAEIATAIALSAAQAAQTRARRSSTAKDQRRGRLRGISRRERADDCSAHMYDELRVVRIRSMPYGTPCLVGGRNRSASPVSL